MRTALIIEHLDPIRGGAEYSCMEMARLLARNGVEVTVIAATVGEAVKADDCGFRIVDLGVKSRSRVRIFKTLTVEAQKLTQNETFDIVHAIAPIPNADVYQPRGGLIDEAFERNMAKYSPTVARLRRLIGPNGKQRRVRREEKYLAARTNCMFLAVSDYVRRQFYEHLQLSDDRIRVIYNGVNTERFGRADEPERIRHLRGVLDIGDDRLVGLFVANNLKLKGIDPLFAALRYLRATNAAVFEDLRIIIVGTDDFWPFYKRARRWGLLDTLLFLGPAKDMSSLYYLADFLVHPTWYDPCSRVVLEAIACRLAVITSRFNGASEIVAKADCGIVVTDLTDPGGLAGAIATINDAEKRKRLADNCRAAIDQISMARHIRELIELYKELKNL